jgi:hypothetical protein
MYTKYPKPEWACQQVWRLSGLIEDICEHGVGHPNRKWLSDNPDKSYLGIHGCDGCCLRGVKDESHPKTS